MMPTPLAENIVGRVREAMQLLDSSAHEGDVFDPASSTRVFRMSMSDLTEALLLPALGELLQTHAPGMHVRSYDGPPRSRDRARERLRRPRDRRTADRRSAPA